MSVTFQNSVSIGSPTSLVSSMMTTHGDMTLGPNETEGMAKHHLMKQAKISRELEELNNMLERKQYLAQQMNNNEQTISTMKVEYDKNTKELEKEVQQLQQEKDDLMNQLNTQKKDANAKKYVSGCFIPFTGLLMD